MGAENGQDVRGLPGRVFDEVRARIFDGRFQPGDALRERELGAELNVSRVPIREALTMLEAAGLVTMSPRRPAVVTVVTRTSVDELFAVRSALEPFVAREAARQVHAGKDPAVLLGAVSNAEQALGRDDLVAFAAAGGDFHTAVEQLAGNALYSAVVEPLRERTSRLNAANVAQAPHARHQEHVALAEAISQGESELASALAYAHVVRGRTRVFATLSDLPGYDPEG